MFIPKQRRPHVLSISAFFEPHIIYATIVLCPALFTIYGERLGSRGTHLYVEDNRYLSLERLATRDILYHGIWAKPDRRLQIRSRSDNHPPSIRSIMCDRICHTSNCLPFGLSRRRTVCLRAASHGRSTRCASDIRYGTARCFCSVPAGRFKP